MRRYVFPLAMITLALIGPGVVRGDEEQDNQIAQQIVQKLQAEKKAGTLKGFSIDMQVDEGTVWLSGRVATPEQQAKALDIARRIPGVKQVVNDLSVATAEPRPARSLAAAAAASGASPAGSPGGGMISNMGKALANAVRRPEAEQQQRIPAQQVSTSQEPSLAVQSAIGSGVDPSAPISARRSSVVQAAQPVANIPQGVAVASLPQEMPPRMTVAVPVYAGSQAQVPLAYAPASTVNHEAMGPLHRRHAGGMGAPMMDPMMGGPSAGNIMSGGGGGPVPMYMPGSGVGIAPARFDHPAMPGYAWPSYAAHPNYAAVTYPKQYSPTAWPYIGPFYPYPQVPLGWRKVTLEWDDGWWFLDFKDRRTMYNHK